MIPKQRTAFVFIWCDCLHALLLAAVRERGTERERERQKERERERSEKIKRGGCRRKKEKHEWRVMGGKRERALVSQ